MEEIRIKNSPKKYIILLIAAVGFVVAGLFIVLNSPSPGDRWIGWTSIVFFGSGVLIFIKNILDAKPRLVINDQGVFDRTLGIGTIPWSEVTGAYVKSIQGNDFICMELRNPQIWSNQSSGIRKAVISANKALGFTEFSLNLSGTNTDATVIHELIIKKVAEHSVIR